MTALLEQDLRAMSFEDVRRHSRQLADDLSKLAFNREGFSESEYMTLDGPYLVELIQGKLQVLPMPSAFHQSILGFVYLMLRMWASKHTGVRVMTAPFRIRLGADHYREPDIAVMLARNADRCSQQQWIGADFVVEIVSDSNRAHDTTTKRVEYAKAGIGEYWIIDPTTDPTTDSAGANPFLSVTLTQLLLVEGEYVEAARLVDSGMVHGKVLDGFSMDVSQMLADAKSNS